MCHAAYDIYIRMEDIGRALQEGDIFDVIVNVTVIIMDIVTIGSSCFDGDTLVATEDGYARIDEIKEGDKVRAYNRVAKKYHKIEGFKDFPEECFKVYESVVDEDYRQEDNG